MTQTAADRSLRNRRAEEVDAQTTTAPASGTQGSAAARNQARFGNAAVVRSQTAPADRSADREASESGRDRERDREEEGEQEAREREESPRSGESQGDRTPGVREADDGADREGEQPAVATEATAEESEEERRIRRYARELNTPPPTPPPERLPAIMPPAPQPLIWEPVMALFVPPGMPDFNRLSHGWQSNDPATEAEVRREAKVSLKQRLSEIRRHHDMAAYEANGALQSLSSLYSASRLRLQSEFLRNDYETEMVFNQSLLQARGGAEAADRIILRNYMLARRSLSGAATTAKRGIQANKDNSEAQIREILSGLRRGFVTPLTEARQACRDQNRDSRRALQEWKRGIDEHYPDSGELAHRIENEAKRAVGPGLADDALDQLSTNANSVITRFSNNITAVRSDVEARVAPSLRRYTSTMVHDGNEDVDEAFNRAFGALKRQANQARQAIAEQHTQIVAQLTALRSAERERLEMLMQQTLEAVHQEASAAADLVVSTTGQAMPHYSGAARQLTVSMSKAARNNPASLRNMAGNGAEQVSETVANAHGLQRHQLETSTTGIETSLNQRELEIRTELMEISFSVAQNLQGAAGSGEADMLSAATAMTEGLSSLSRGVTAAAAQWLRPLSEAFSNFLTETRADLERGRPAFMRRVGTAKSDFLRYARAQGNPNRLFASSLLGAATSAMTKARTARTNLGHALDAGIFDVIDEEGVGNALRGLTALQGQWVQGNWPYSNSNWPSTIPEGMLRVVYYDVTGSRDYSLDGHLMFALGGPGGSDYNAAKNYLAGNTAEGARFELEASIHWYNDEESRIENIQKGLTNEQLRELRGMDAYQRNTRSRVRGALDGTDLNVFDALEQGDHARAEAYRMLDKLDNARNRNEIDKTNDILSEYSTGTEWGGERVSAAERRAAVQIALAEIRGTSREELEAQASEQNRQREAEVRERAEARQRQSRQEPASPTEATSEEALQMCIEPPAANSSQSSEIDPSQLMSRLSDAEATSTPVEATVSENPDGAEQQEQPSLAERWMQGTAPAPATITAADVAGNMLYEYATRDIEQVRSAGRGGTYTVTLRMSDRQRDLARALIFHGEGSPEARAARLGVEVERSGKPNIVNVDRALVDPRLNPDSLAAIDDPVARQRVIDNARRDRERMLAIFARDYGGVEGGTSAEHINVLVGQLEAAFGSDEAGAELAGLMVRDEYPTTDTAAKAVEYAIEGAGTNNELYFRVTERLNREDFQEMRRKYNDNTGGELYNDLGLFGNGWFGDFSGDDRLRAERGTLGQPRNDRERAEVAAFAIHQQRDEAVWLGGALASGSMQEIMLDVEEADLNAMIGGPIEFGPEAQPIWTTTANFDRNNDFVGDQAMFRATATSAQTAARNYSAKIDQYANFAATAIAVVGAVVAAVVTVLTGGAASPLLLASIAAITGLTAMGAQAAIKGGRYGWEQAVTDLGMTAVQALTAGVGQSLALASRGGMAGLQAGMKAGLSMSAARELARGSLLGNMGRLTGSAFMDKLLIGMGTGALGSTGSAALDERTWARGGAKGIENLFAASFRGMLSGGVTAGVSNTLEDLPLGRLSQLVGNNKNIGEAIGSSTSMLGRGLGKGVTSSVGAFAGRASELGFESARGTYQGDAGDIFLESSKAGGMSLLQSIGEGGAEARAQALFNARYRGRPPVKTERAVIHEAEEARARAQQLEAEAAAHRSARQPSVEEAAPARIAEEEIPLARARDTELPEERGLTPRRPTEAETERRAPADRDVEARRRPEAEPTARELGEETRLPREQPEQRRPSVDEAPLLDLEQTRKALAELAEAPVEPMPAAPAKAGAAAAIEESAQMRLLPESLDTTPAMLHDAAGVAIGRVSALAHAEITTGGGSELRVKMTRADGAEVSVRVEFGETRGGDIASFRAADPGDDVQFVVTLSNRAPEAVHARAIGHELAEIRLHGIEGAAAESDLLTTTVRPGDDARLSAHDVGRLAELEVLSTELAAARAATDDPFAPTVRRLESEIDALARHLGLSYGVEDDRRLTSTLAALPGESEAASALASARERASALAPARAIDAETRLTAADREQFASLDAKAEALERARETGDMKARAKAQREVEDLIDRLGLNDTDEATGRRVELALSGMAEDSPGARALRAASARQVESGLNDALRPGHTPDPASVLSDRDRSRVAELTDSLRQLHAAEAASADPTKIARLRHEAQAKATEMGLVFGDDAARARTRFLEASLSPEDAHLIPQLHEVRESARSSALLQPRRGTLEDLPLIASQIAEARAMGDMTEVARLTELAGFRLEHAGHFHADEAVQNRARQEVDRIVGDNPDARALADDALTRHGQRLAAEAIDNELDSVRVGIEEVRQQIAEAKADTTQVAEGVRRRRGTKQYLEDLDALIQRQAKLERDAATARRIAFRPPDTSEAAARAMPPDSDTIRNAPLLRSEPDFAGNGERVRLVRQRYGDSPMFQSWERFKQMYVEQNPSVKAISVRSNTQRDTDFVIDALERERLFNYWSQGRYVNEGAPRSRSLPDLSFIPAGKGNPVEFNDPQTGARVRLSPSDEATLRSGETLTPSSAAKRRRDLMRDRDILQARLDLETDTAKREQLTSQIKERAQQIIDVSEAMGEAAGLRFAATLPGGREAAEVGRGPGVTDVVHIDPVTGRVSVIECKGGTSQLGSRIAEVEGRRVRAEQTTPEYLRSLANEMIDSGHEQSQRLGEAILHALENDPPGIDSFVVRQPFDNSGNPGAIEVTHYPVKSGS